MGNKLPYMPFYHADYQRDTRCLSLEARGGWMDILITLWNSKTRGKKTLTLTQWAGEIGKPPAEVALVIREIKACEIANLTLPNDLPNGLITIINRRMLREEKARQSNRIRQKRHYDREHSREPNAVPHASITAKKSEIRNQSQISESEEDKKEKKEQEKKIPTPGSPQRAAKSSGVWHTYSVAYRLRYGVLPVRNHKTNSLLCQLVDRLGVDAPDVAGFYCSHNAPLYVRARHPPDLLIRDCEGLRTQWVTGTKATTKEAQSAEQADNAREQLKRVAKLTEVRHG